MSNTIIDVGQSGGESATVYIQTPRGKVKVIVSHNLSLDIEVEDGEDWAGTTYTWGRSGVYFGDNITQAIDNVKGPA